MKNNFMVDLETMGTRHNSMIVSIGVVQFDLTDGSIGKEFYRTVDMKRSEQLGFTKDQATIEWWSKQDKSIRAQLLINPQPIDDVLNDLTIWLKQSCRSSKYL